MQFFFQDKITAQPLQNLFRNCPIIFKLSFILCCSHFIAEGRDIFKVCKYKTKQKKTKKIQTSTQPTNQMKPNPNSLKHLHIDFYNYFPSFFCSRILWIIYSTLSDIPRFVLIATTKFPETNQSLYLKILYVTWI